MCGARPATPCSAAGVPAVHRGGVFGLHRAADTAGAVVGPLLGLAAYTALDHRIRPLLIIAVVPAVLSVLLVAAVHEAPRPLPVTGPAPVPTPAPHPVAPGQPRAYRRVLLILVLFSLVNFPDALLLLRLHEIGFGVSGVVAAYVAYNACYALLSYPAGALADRWPRHRVYALGLACFAVAYLGLGLVESPAWALVLLIVYGGFAASPTGSARPGSPARPRGPAGPGAGPVPGAHRRGCPGRRPVGRARLGCGRRRAAADLGRCGDRADRPAAGRRAVPAGTVSVAGRPGSSIDRCQLPVRGFRSPPRPGMLSWGTP